MKRLPLCLFMIFFANIVCAQTEKNYFRDAFRNRDKPRADSLLIFPLRGHMDFVIGSGPIPMTKLSYGTIALRITDANNEMVYQVLATNADVELMPVDKDYCRLMLLNGRMLVKERGNIKDCERVSYSEFIPVVRE